METEKLKVIAEGMGYILNSQGIPIQHNGLEVFYLHVTDAAPYNPLTNAEQCMEIMEKLKLTIWYEPAISEWCASKQDSLGSTNYQDEGKTINEAVCNAAFEYFKEMKL